MKTPRRRSIRFSLYGLLVIPMVSLVTLWVFAAQGAATDSIRLLNIGTANEIYGDAVQPMLVTLAQERQESVVWLSGGRRKARTTLDSVRTKMDGTIVQMNRAAESEEFQGTLSPEMKGRLSALIGKLNRIEFIRDQVDRGDLTKLQAYNAYNDVLDTHFRFIYLLVAGNNDMQAYHLTGMSRAIELAGREAALVGGVIVGGGRMTTAERSAVAQVAFERRYLETSSLSEFTKANGAPFRDALASADAREFSAVENRILASDPDSRLAISSATWQKSARGYIAAMNDGLFKSRMVLAEAGLQSAYGTFIRLGLVGGLGLIAIIVTAVLMLRFSRRISGDLRGLQDAAHDLAEERLPGVVSRLKRGEDVDVAVEAPPLTVGRTAEVFNVATTFSTVQRTAIEAAVGQAELRQAVNKVFQNLARRNQSLLHRQLQMLDTLERNATDSEALADLFAIDHLTTRMRRHAEGLIILSGAAPGRGWRHPIGVVDVLRGAVGEIEDFSRVEVLSTAEEGIVGSAVADVIHLLAELIENAASLSPPNTPVEVDAGLVGQGVVVEIQDRGLGMSPEKLAALNAQLGREPEFELSDGEQLGLFVVGSLAHRHGIKVTMEPNAYGGLKTIVLLPHSIVVAAGWDERAGATAAGAADDAAEDVLGGAVLGGAVPAGAVPAGSVPAMAGEIRGTDDGPYAMGATGRHRVGASDDGPGASASGTLPSEAPEPAAPASPPASPSPGTSITAGTHAGMPRRVRRANLAPQLLEQSSPTPPGEPLPKRVKRSPEQARSVMGSMQSGWQRARAESSPPPGAAGGTGHDDDEGQG